MDKEYIEREFIKYIKDRCTLNLAMAVLQDLVKCNKIINQLKEYLDKNYLINTKDMKDMLDGKYCEDKIYDLIKDELIEKVDD